MNDAPLRFPARSSALNEVLTHVATLCRQARIREIEKVTLVIEELFSNTVRHGYRQESEQPVWIFARCDQGHLYLTYQDQAPAFNPLDHASSPAPDLPGGWGIGIIRNFSEPSYRRENGRNTLTLTFKISPPDESHDTRAD